MLFLVLRYYNFGLRANCWVQKRKLATRALGARENRGKAVAAILAARGAHCRRVGELRLGSLERTTHPPTDRQQQQGNLRVTRGVRQAGTKSPFKEPGTIHHGSVPGTSLRQHSLWSGSWVGPTSMNDEPCCLQKATTYQTGSPLRQNRRRARMDTASTICRTPKMGSAGSGNLLFAKRVLFSAPLRYFISSDTGPKSHTAVAAAKNRITFCTMCIFALLFS